MYQSNYVVSMATQCKEKLSAFSRGRPIRLLTCCQFSNRFSAPGLLHELAAPPHPSRRCPTECLPLFLSYAHACTFFVLFSFVPFSLSLFPLPSFPSPYLHYFRIFNLFSSLVPPFSLCFLSFLSSCLLYAFLLTALLPSLFILLSFISKYF
jgi:hypothetical protein